MKCVDLSDSGNGRWLAADLTIDCDAGAHAAVQAVVGAAALLLLLVLPALAARKIWRARRTLDTDPRYRALRFLYDGPSNFFAENTFSDRTHCNAQLRPG